MNIETIRPIALDEKFAEFEAHWSPQIIARYNANEVRLVRTLGEWVWHKHDETDELFIIVEGQFDMDFERTCDRSARRNSRSSRRC